MQLIHGECLTEMATLPAGSADLILCDLPYGTTACAWDAVIPFEPLWAQYRRIAKPNAAIVLTASQPFTTQLIASNFADFRYCWVWDKKIAGNPFLAKRQPMKRHEDVCVFSVKAHRYFPQMTTGKMRTKGGGHSKLFDVALTSSVNDQYYPTSIVEFSNAQRGVHPTQKPVALMEYLIRTYTNPGDVVLDNCMGSGTTGVAAIQSGRRFIGIERDPGYFAICQKRIAAAAPARKSLVIDLAAVRAELALAPALAALRARLRA
jgi:site-specific DNA-methyltransferase (adenine-specific)